MCQIEGMGWRKGGVAGGGEDEAGIKKPRRTTGSVQDF